MTFYCFDWLPVFKWGSEIFVSSLCLAHSTWQGRRPPDLYLSESFTWQERRLPVLYCSWTFVWFAQGRKDIYLLPDMIRNVSPQVQQELAKVICECSATNDRVILCHTPALLEPIDQCTLGTFDQFDECFEANMNVSLILPTLSSETTYLPIDEANAQARGLGNMVAFWERLRNVCPRIATYNGPILTHLGEPCKTAEDLDAAMLAAVLVWRARVRGLTLGPLFLMHMTMPLDGLLFRLLIVAPSLVPCCTPKTPHQDLMEYPMQLGESCRMLLCWQWIVTCVISSVTRLFPQCR